MKKYFLLFFIILFFNSVIEASNVGKKFPSERKTWTDSETGFEITQWTNNTAKSWHLYFNIESFMDNNHAIIFSEREGNKNLFILEFTTGELTQITDEDSIQGAVWHLPQYNKLYYMLNDNTLKSIDTKTYDTKAIKKFDVPISSFTVTSDDKWFVFSSEKIYENNSNKSIGPFFIYKYGFDSKELVQITPGYGFVIGHLQASPTDPDLVSFCWQHLINKDNGTQGDTPQRIWQVNIKESEVKPIALQETGLHRTHEFWFYDGSKIGYSARYTWGKNKGKQFIGFCNPDGSENIMMSAPVGPAHSQMYKDNVHWVSDLFDGSVLVLFSIQNGQIEKSERLFKHDSSWKGQPSHPHPHFSPDGDRILFSTDKTGIPQVYSVKINLNGK
ncbi:MAG: oligogalacturonate lyase family protein [Melioribacteraceae bacterium]|nr:oligogalacturonate lyase family protein [Melioribacteraceae bacterium]